MDISVTFIEQATGEELLDLQQSFPISRGDVIFISERVEGISEYYRSRMMATDKSSKYRVHHVVHVFGPDLYIQQVFVEDVPD